MLNHVLLYHWDQLHSGTDSVPSAHWYLFYSGTDSVPNASGHFVARGRQGHICG